MNLLVWTVDADAGTVAAQVAGVVLGFLHGNPNACGAEFKFVLMFAGRRTVRVGFTVQHGGGLTCWDGGCLAPKRWLGPSVGAVELADAVRGVIDAASRAGAGMVAEGMCGGRGIACARDVRRCLELVDDPLAASILDAVADDLEQLIKEYAHG